MDSLRAIKACGEIAAMVERVTNHHEGDGLYLRPVGFHPKPHQLRCMKPYVLDKINALLASHCSEAGKREEFFRKLNEEEESRRLIMDEMKRINDAISLFTWIHLYFKQAEETVKRKQRLEKMSLIDNAKIVSNTLSVSERHRFWVKINDEVNVKYSSSVDEYLDQIPVVKRYLNELECLLAEKKAKLINNEVLIGHLMDLLGF
jgi:hypothetical protein